MLKNNKSDEFRKMLPNFFAGAIAAHGKLQKEKEITSAEGKTQIIFGFEPIIDLMDLCGYSKIYSELYVNPELWEISQKVWTSYLDAHTNQVGVVQLLVSVYELRKSQIALRPRDILRTNWEIQLKAILREQNLVDGHGNRGAYRDEPPLEHLRPFVRALCGGRFEPHIAAVEVFILTYLLNRPEAKTLVWQDRGHFLRRLKEETNRQYGDNVGRKDKG